MGSPIHAHNPAVKHGRRNTGSAAPRRSNEQVILYTHQVSCERNGASQRTYLPAVGSSKGAKPSGRKLKCWRYSLIGPLDACRKHPPVPSRQVQPWHWTREYPRSDVMLVRGGIISSLDSPTACRGSLFTFNPCNSIPKISLAYNPKRIAYVALAVCHCLFRNIPRTEC